MGNLSSPRSRLPTAHARGRVSLVPQQDLENDDEPRTTPRSEELRAFSVIAEVLQALDPDAQRRVLTTVLTFFDLAPTRSLPGPSPVTHPTTSREREPQFSADRSPSPKQFILEKRPMTEVDRIVCLAYYLTHYREQQFFRTLDLSTLNTEAAQVKFANATKAVENATTSGFLIPGNKGFRQLSAVGEIYVQHLPDKERARAEVAQQRPRAKAKRRGGE